jgi:hypothetical protein
MCHAPAPQRRGLRLSAACHSVAGLPRGPQIAAISHATIGFGRSAGYIALTDGLRATQSVGNSRAGSGPAPDEGFQTSSSDDQQ